MDKVGEREFDEYRMSGDIVYCFDKFDFLFIVGIGDIGKMGRKDDILKGLLIIMKVVEFILERSGYYVGL